MDKLPSSGGSYIVDSAGELTQTTAPTADHPEGNRAREAEEVKTTPAAAPKKIIKKETEDGTV